MNIAVIGCGYVGLTTAVALALMGHKVIGVDIDKTKVDKLNNKQPTIYEKGLPEALKQTIESENLEFTTELSRAIKSCDYLFVAVPTPSKPNGECNVDYVAGVVKNIDQLSPSKQKIIIIKSTIPIGTCEELRTILDNKQHVIVHNPEFLREGTALEDSLNPERVVFGLPSFIPKPVGQDLRYILQNEIYRFDKDIPVILTDTNTSETVKYACNAFLATKISFINEISELCNHTNANIRQVAEIMGMDSRIGPKFLKAGLGWSGSCLPKDTRALVCQFENRGIKPNILLAAIERNKRQQDLAIKLIWNGLGGQPQGKTVTALGMTFKPGTDDIRESNAVELINRIVSLGTKVRAYDPTISQEQNKINITNVEVCKSAYSAVTNSDCVVLLTDWPDFKQLDWCLIRELVSTDCKTVVDTRNYLDRDVVESNGFIYEHL